MAVNDIDGFLDNSTVMFADDTTLNDRDLNPTVAQDRASELLERAKVWFEGYKLKYN